ncbi:MAG: AMIN domain-containing protein [Gemmataceae bacterium]|nr:AMIN domain-containing protein [Gemmataceae bacterium]
MHARRLDLLIIACAAIVPSGLCADPISLAVDRGQCTFTVDAKDPQSSWWLVLGAAAPSAKPCSINVRCEPARGNESLPRSEEAGPSSAWRALRREQLARWEQTVRIEDGQMHARREPERTRGFWMLQRDRDLDDPNSYAHLKATLVGTGVDCAVYLDESEACDERLQTLAAMIVRVFDSEVLPWMTKHLGRADDVDRDGRFCILLTSRVATMQGTAGSLQGFVRGSDFHRDLEAPFGNRCDMMYVSSKVSVGPTLKALLAHEYSHAVVFAERVLRPRLPNAERKDEESWLSEGLSHLIERAMVPDSPHLDHRLSAYFNAPARHRLVVADYFADRVWRDPGTRGAAIAFLEWCQAREPDLVRRLGRTSHRGVANLEIAMQTPFENLFRAWAVSQVEWLQGESSMYQPAKTDSTSLIAPWTKSLFAAGRARPTSVSKDETPSRFLLAGPRFSDVKLGSAELRLELAGAAVSYIRLHAAQPGKYRVAIDSLPSAELQATLVPIAAEIPSLSMRVQREGDRLMISTSSNADLKLFDGAIEFARPGPRLFAETPVRRFMPRDLNASTLRLELDSTWQTEDLVVKVMGLDRQQRRAVGWALVPAAK